MKPGAVFNRRTIVLLATLVGMAVTFSMGQWQMRRAATKQAVVDARAAQQERAPLDGSALGAAGDSVVNREGLIYRKVELRGQWDAGHTVYLDNRQMQGRTGFYVLTPLKLEPSGVAIVVQRGWVPRNFNDRTAVPALDSPSGVVTVQGQLTPWPSRMYDFGSAGSGAIRQNLDFEAYRQESGLPLLELSVQQSGDAADGLLRDWPVIASGVEKHHGYAFQWFGLCTLIALLYVWFQIVQPRRKQHAG